jgi:hypothetical protein
MYEAKKEEGFVVKIAGENKKSDPEEEEPLPENS